MTTGSDNLGNGVAKTEDRFAGQLGYRPRGNRDGGSLPAGRSDSGPLNSNPLTGPLHGPLSGPINGPRGGRANGSSLNGSPLSSPLSGPLGATIGAEIGAAIGDAMGDTRGDTRGEALNGSSLNGANPLDSGPLAAPALHDLGSPVHTENLIASTLTEPKLADPDPVDPFHEPNLLGSDSWLETGGKGVVDHPLLRGLLLELPPKGSTLQVQWLDRWFEAARSIVELLYRFDDKRD